MCVQLLQSCLTLGDPLDTTLVVSVHSTLDCIPPHHSVHGILQAGILEWVAISFSRGTFPTQGSNLQSPVSPSLAGGFFTTEPPGKPLMQ